MNYFRRRVAPPPATDWGFVETRCTATSESWTVPQLSATLNEHVRSRIRSQQPLVQPRDWTLIRLPIIASTPEQPPMSFNVTLPLPGRLDAQPTYTWDFGDGETAQGAGRPYDGTDPRDNPEHYVSHAYQRKGPHQVQLTTTWNATFTVAGIQIPLETITNTYGPVPVDVRTARSRLVAND